MERTTRIFTLLCVGLTAVTLCPNAEAQLGGLKKKLKEAVTGTDPKAKQAEAGPRFDDNVVEITEPVLDAFVRGLQTEIALRKEFRDQLSKYPTREQYAECSGQATISPEGQSLAAKMAASKQSMEDFRAEMAALVKRKCPLDPDEWTSAKKLERLKEIEAKAAEATGSASPGGEELNGWRMRSGPSEMAVEPADNPLSAMAYRIVKERLIAFCMTELASPGVDYSVVPARGGGYVYTSSEAQLLQRRCLLIQSGLRDLSVLVANQVYDSFDKPGASRKPRL